MAKRLVGEVLHFFDKIGVAALKVSGEFKIGDKISVESKDGTIVCKQTVMSMQVNHNPVNVANPGDDVAIKLEKKVHQGDKVYKITE